MSWKRKLRQKIINLGIATYFATWFLEPFYFNVIGVAPSRYWSINTATIHDLLKRFVPFGDWKFVVKERFRPLPFGLLWFFLNSTNSPCRSKGKFLLMENPASWLHYVKMLRGRSEVWRQSGTSYHLPLRPFACWILSEDVTIQWLGVLRNRQ